MSEEETSKYVHLGRGYDKDWFFIKDDAELEAYKKDNSFDDNEYVIEIKKVFKCRKIVEITMELDEVKRV